MLNVIFYIIALVLIYCIATVPQNLMQGYTGLLSLSLAATFGIGAYGTGIAMQQLHFPFLLALLFSVILAMVLQVLMAYPSLRLSDLYFVVGTLAFQFIISSVMINSEVTGGAAGLFGLPTPSVFTVELGSPSLYVIICALFAIICFAITYHFAHSSFGLKLRGVRDNLVAMESLGFNGKRQKVLVAGYYAIWAGLAGGLFAGLVSTVDPSPFGFSQSILMQSFIIVGGTGSLFGSILGVTILVAFPELLRYIGVSGSYSGMVREILYGALLVVLMRFRPEGIIAESPADAGWKWLAPGKVAGQAENKQEISKDYSQILAPTVSIPSKTGQPLLEAKDIHVNFGGLQALAGASVKIYEGAITGIIGPNGAGKSTLFNVISGFLSSNQGEIILNEANINEATAQQRVMSGITRTFQELRLFNSLTVRQNIALSLVRRNDNLKSKTSADSLCAEIEGLVEFFKLNHVADLEVGSLSYGDQKFVSLARAVATGSKILLLDEPASGLDKNQIAELISLMKKLVERGRTICLVEHNMDIVRAVSDYVYVLHQGGNIRDGKPEEVLMDAKVLEVYIGA